MSRRTSGGSRHTPSAARFIALRVRHVSTLHGYDADQREVATDAEPGPYVDKLVAIERIQSVGKRYLLLTGAQGRLMYWAYEGGFAALRERLAAAGLLLH